MEQLKDKLEKVMDEHYTLGCLGYGLGADYKDYEPNPDRPCEGAEVSCLRQGLRHDLRENSFDEIKHVIKWLQDVDKSASFSNISSDVLKNLAKKTAPGGCIMNGSFIAGAIIAGFEAKRQDDNAIFNMSERCIERKRQAIIP